MDDLSPDPKEVEALARERARQILLSRAVSERLVEIIRALDVLKERK